VSFVFARLTLRVFFFNPGNMSDDDFFCAAQRGALDPLLERLLQEGASPVVIESALEVAIWNDHGQIVGAIVRLMTNAGAPIPWAKYLEMATRRDSTAAAHVLTQCCSGALAEGPDYVAAALEMAAGNGSAATLAALMPHVTCVQARGSALASAVRTGHTRNLRTLLIYNKIYKSKLVLTKLLHFAALTGQTQIARQLLGLKADIHEPNRGRTALVIAFQRGHHATAAVLRRFAAKAITPRPPCCGVLPQKQPTTRTK